MPTVYEIFKMIFGLVASVFILYFLITYAGGYAGTQLSAQRISITRDFLTASENVYLSGVPFIFDGFGRQDFEYSLDASGTQPQIEFGSGQLPVRVPLFFSPGKELYIERKELDLGWWKFGFAMATPEMDIIFNVQDPEGMDAAVGIASLFPESQEPEISFTLCDGAELEGPYGQFDFAGSRSPVIRNIRPALPCSASLQKGSILVTISSSCSSSMQAGICIRPSDGTAFISGSQKEYIYKDSLDLAALVLGGDRKDLFGNYIAETLYTYKNRVVGSELRLASVVLEGKARLLEGRDADCDYSRLVSSLRELRAIVSGKDYYLSRHTGYTDANLLLMAEQERLEALGCGL
ncbi:MAG: hypothetical protein HY367_03205 [Candidatus Aenigmarchaeota archaeon]|nr:hypothetical protein [Candidatus Aenigmarchaeota archaeon]